MLLVVDGLKAIKDYEKEFKAETREYKKIFKGWGYTYKKVKPKTAKRPYHYWYKWEYSAETKNNEWTYIGKDKPEASIPDPPMNRLDEVDYSIAGSTILLQREEYSKIQDLLEGFQVFEVNPS